MILSSGHPESVSNMTEVWAKWENRVINGVFPLRRFLGKSDHSVVFLTEYAAQNYPDAAIKLVPADPAQAETQLAYWRSAAALSHPHLIRILDIGRCRLGGHPFLFLVMEYAEETLAQVLPQRALSPDEVRGLLNPTLDALAYLHGKNLVHGQLKPPNILVVGDQVRLSSDNIHPAGKSRPTIAKPSPYDPPEARIRGLSAAGDVWGLGNVIAESLTQRLPEWFDERSEMATLPANLSPDFVDIVRRCLSRSSAERPTLDSLGAQLNPSASRADTYEPVPAPAPEPAPVPSSAPAPAPELEAAPALEPAVAFEAAAELASVMPPPLVPVPTPAALEAALGTPAQQKPPTQSRVALWVVLGITLAALAAWAGLHRRQVDAPLAASAAVAASAAPLAAAPTNPNSPLSAEPPPRALVAKPAAPAAETPRSVIHEELPNISHSSRESIRGTIKVTVRVTVDRSGKVIEEALENRGSSKYFARLSLEAGRKWRFAAADHPEFRTWLLQFEFSRGGTAGHATPRS